MTPYLSIGIAEASQVGEARRAAARLADSISLDEVTAGRIAIAVTELATNLVRHATGGRLLIGRRAGTPDATLEVVSVDTGPGMEDLDRCLRDGYSTGGTPGTGLGAVRRLADDFAIRTSPGRGTLAVARFRAPTPASASATAARLPGRGNGAAFVHAGLAVAAPGENVCGDAWSIRTDGDKAWVLVADGLGHGPIAAEAADAAVAAFEQTTGAPAAVLERAHQALRSTRGAAVALAALDATAGTIEFCGAGNVAGRLVSGVDDRSLLSQHGTVGLQMRRLQTATYAWPPHAVLVMHTDGITSRWNVDEARDLLSHDPALLAASLLRDHVRGRDDATVVAVRRA